eukprot:TRINITY_DN6713_c0_g1_i4.p2 TRINITY_DN6713_c0_g1~~TRINITY_DN6713_c0_g1_i4.p2  ORF type:complete len:161 (+),score=0.22 TRINITY_DN6713_c0_g1_i4:64-546(+)
MCIRDRFLINHFTLNPYNSTSWRQHTLVTHAFSHTQLFHFFFNMITLYFMGRGLEYRFGSKMLLQLYLGGAIVGAIINNMKNRQGIHLGANSSIMAILTYFIASFPQETILLFFIPVPAWVVGALIIVQSMFISEQSGSTMGGVMAGLMMFLYKRGGKLY